MRRSFLVMLLIIGCGDDDGDLIDAGPPDASVADARVFDSGFARDGGPDAPTLDGGTPDAPAQDGAIDAESADTGIDAFEPSGQVTLHNGPSSACVVSGYISATLPANAGHFAASRLTPNAYPFTVTAVAYHLPGDPGCDNTLAHEVRLFAVTGDVLPGSPSVDGAVTTIAVPGASALSRTIVLPLEDSIELTAGQSLVVAIQVAANEALDESMCLESCDDVAVAGTDYWSFTTDEPYAWRDLNADFGNEASLTVRVIGSNP